MLHRMSLRGSLGSGCAVVLLGCVPASEPIGDVAETSDSDANNSPDTGASASDGGSGTGNVGPTCGPSTCGACPPTCIDAHQCIDGQWECDCDCTLDTDDNGGGSTTIDSGSTG